MLDTLKAQLADTLNTVTAFLPVLVGGLAIIAIGWLLAKLLRSLSIRLLQSCNGLLGRLLQGDSLRYLRLSPGTIRFIGHGVFWLTLLVFAAAAIRVWGLTELALWLDGMVSHLPRLATGILIIIAGYILGGAIKNIGTHAALSANINQPELAGRVSQVLVVTVIAVIGLDQMGINVTFLAMLLAITFAAILAGFMLAFGLGARQLVADLVAVRHLRTFVKPGQLAKVGDIQGRVLEFTATGMVVESDRGRTLLGASRCLRDAVTVLTPEQDDAQI